LFLLKITLCNCSLESSIFLLQDRMMLHDPAQASGDAAVSDEDDGDDDDQPDALLLRDQSKKATQQQQQHQTADADYAAAADGSPTHVSEMSSSINWGAIMAADALQ
jgi:hypothetical protein